MNNLGLLRSRTPRDGVRLSGHVLHPSSSALALWKVQEACCPGRGGFGGAGCQTCRRQSGAAGPGRWGRQGAGAAGLRALPALPAARGGVLRVQGGCAGSGTHLCRAGRGFRNCWRRGGSSDGPLLAKEDPMIIYKLAVRGPGAFHISKEPLELAG